MYYNLLGVVVLPGATSGQLRPRSVDQYSTIGVLRTKDVSVR